MTKGITRKHGPNPLHNSIQTYSNGKEILTSKFPLPFPLNIHYLLCSMEYWWKLPNGYSLEWRTIIFQVGNVPKSRSENEYWKTPLLPEWI